MIWTRGEILTDDALRISALDRSFEHGLGLFETLRTWDGMAVLLSRHLDRMSRSAEALGISLDPASLPDDGAVADLVESSGLGADVLLRVTASGGGPGPSVVWMRSAPLPPPDPTLRVAVDRSTTLGVDAVSGHKTLNYWSRRIAHARAFGRGYQEVLIADAAGAWEGSRSSVFAVRRGRLATPPTELSEFPSRTAVLPGIMRGLVLERADALGIRRSGEPLDLGAIRSADEVFLTNSVRGIMPVGELDGKRLDAPGPITLALESDVRGWIARGGRDA